MCTWLSEYWIPLLFSLVTALIILAPVALVCWTFVRINHTRDYLGDQIERDVP